MTHKAIFVVRYFGGIKMGPARFECIIEAARSALMQDPYNHVLGKEQKLLPPKNPHGRPNEVNTSRMDRTDVTRGARMTARGKSIRGAHRSHNSRGGLSTQQNTWKTVKPKYQENKQGRQLLNGTKNSSQQH